MSTKKKTNTKNAEDDETSNPEARPADLRHAGDGSGMMDAKTLAAIHGEDVLKANVEKARRIRAENGE